MAASYPSSVRSFSTKRNTLDIVDASDPNSLQEEVIAIESTLGVNPNVSTSPSVNGSFANTATTFASVAARLANIEIGVVSDAHTQYIRRTGNETLTNAIASNVAFIVKGATSQSADLQQWRTSSNNIVARIDSSGTFTPSKLDAVEIDNLTVMGMWA